MQARGIPEIESFRQLLFGKYSTFVPPIMWTPHQDFPLPTSLARFEGKKDTQSDQSTTFPFVVGQQLFGHMIPRPEQAWLRNTEESTESKKAAMLLQTVANTSIEVNSKHRMTREAGVMLDEGFKVVDMFDEEACFVRDVSKPPPPEESLRELGIEIQQGKTQSMRFTRAWKSVEELPDDKMSFRNSNESYADIEAIRTTDSDIPPIDNRRLRPTREQSEVEDPEPYGDEAKMSWREVDSKNLIPEPISDMRSSTVREQSTIELGVEIMENFSTEMEFAQKSFCGIENPPQTTSPEHTNPVFIEVKCQKDGIEVKPSFSDDSPT